MPVTKRTFERLNGRLQRHARIDDRSSVARGIEAIGKLGELVRLPNEGQLGGEEVGEPAQVPAPVDEPSVYADRTNMLESNNKTYMNILTTI
jgi:hypothetical protein